MLKLTEASDELHVAFGIPRHTARQIHWWAKEQPWPEGTELETPQDYHVTLLFTPTGHGDHSEAWWLEHSDGEEVRIAGVDTFPSTEKNGNYAYVLTVDSDEVKQKAEQLQQRAEWMGLEVSKFPGGYKPHITVAYGPSPRLTGVKAPNFQFDLGESSVSPPRHKENALESVAQFRVSDYHGWSNWDTWNTKLMMDNEQHHYNRMHQIAEQGGGPEELRQHFEPHLIGPYNRERLQEAQEWNAIDPEERRRTIDERDRAQFGDAAVDLGNSLMGDFFHDPGKDDTAELIDPHMVNWDEIHHNILSEYPEDHPLYQQYQNPAPMTVPEEWTKASSEEGQILDHLSLQSVAHNLHYKFEEGGATPESMTEYASRLLKMIGYPDEEMTIQAALQAWQQLYPQDNLLPAAEQSQALQAPPTTPTESFGYGTTSAGKTSMPYDQRRDHSWDSGGCGENAIALQQRHPELRFGVQRDYEDPDYLQDLDDGYEVAPPVKHVFAHNDHYGYDVYGRHSLPYDGGDIARQWTGETDAAYDHSSLQRLLPWDLGVDEPWSVENAHRHIDQYGDPTTEEYSKEGRSSGVSGNFGHTYKKLCYSLAQGNSRFGGDGVFVPPEDGGYVSPGENPFEEDDPRWRQWRAEAERYLWDRPEGGDMQAPNRQPYIGWVPTEHLTPEFDRNDPNLGNPQRVQSVADSLLRTGFRNPIIFDYHPGTGMGHVSEGNHRLTAARASGIPAVPVMVYRSTREPHDPSLLRGPYQYVGKDVDHLGNPRPGQFLHPRDIGLPEAEPWSPVSSKESRISSYPNPLYHWCEVGDLEKWKDPSHTGPGATYLTQSGEDPAESWNPDVPMMVNPMRLTIDTSHLDPDQFDQQYNGWNGNYLYHGVVPPQAVGEIKSFKHPAEWADMGSTVPSQVNNPEDHWPDHGDLPPDQKHDVNIGNDWQWH